MNKKQKKMLIRIIIAGVLMVTFALVPIEGWVRFACFMLPYLTVGYDVLWKALKGIKNRQPFDENFLMAVATIGAIVLGEYTEGVAVILFYQIGELFQSIAVGKSRRSIAALMDIRPDYANIEDENGNLTQVDPDEVAVGSIIVVKPGERVPIDGVIVSGTTSLNTAALTGESVPRDAKENDEVISGCINMTGVIKVRTSCEFGESTVSRILELVENSSSRKSKPENFISKFARVYTPAVCGAALALALIPPVVGLIAGADPQWSTWVYRALTFLVISCPCALVVSIPLSFFAGIGGASRAGVLIKGSNYMEALSRVKTVVFDKTGTMTEGVFEVEGVHHRDDKTGKCTCNTEGITYSRSEAGDADGTHKNDDPDHGNTHDSDMDHGDMHDSNMDHGNIHDSAPDHANIHDSDTGHEHKHSHGVCDTCKGHECKLLELAVLVESASNHPISKSILKAYGREPDRTRVSDVREISGNGITAKVDGTPVAVGNARLMESLGIEAIPCSGVGTVVHVAIDGAYAGHILIGDRVKPQAREAIELLKKKGVSKTVMLTGDIKTVAERVAAELGIDEVRSDLLPANKVEVVESLLGAQTGNATLAFAGDGINDAPVLSRADIGIAMGALGSDAAIEAADIVLMDDNPVKISKAIGIARKCLRIVYENIWFAIGIKVACLVLGAFGITNMWAAIFADVGVMVLAILNAIRALSTKRA